jgi:hypothetical protein
MKKIVLFMLGVIMMASYLGDYAWAQTKIEVSPSVVKPGESVIISGYSLAGSNLFVEISNTRTLVETFNVTTNGSGIFRINFEVPVDFPIDIYTVSLQDSGEKIEVTFIVSRMTQQQLVNMIKTVVENAKRQAESSLVQLKKQGYKIPHEIMKKYTMGIEELRVASDNIQSNNYIEAQASLKKALSLFREVVEHSYGEELAPPIDPEQERLRIQEMIDQLKRQYNRINAVVKRLKLNGFNVNLLEQDLETLKNNIIEAQTLLNEGKYQEAKQNAARTNRLLQLRLEALNQRQIEVTRRLAQKYHITLVNRVESYIDTFQKLQSIRPIQSAIALQELEYLQQNLVESGEDLEQGNIREALREIRSTEFRLRNLPELVNGDVALRLFNRIDQLTVNLQDSSESDANQIENDIEDTKNRLDEYLRKIKSGLDTNNLSSSP